MLIRNAEIWRRGLADVRVEGSQIAAIGKLVTEPGEEVIDAAGGLLLPGLHDHHIHLAATAVVSASTPCGSPDILNEADLAQALDQPGTGWLRGIGYHESVAGMLDAEQLDRLVPDRPVRIQHRTGRMWFLNSSALDQLLASATPPPGLEQEDGRWTGRLFDEDRWMRDTLAGSPPDFSAISRELAAYGITGLTDMTPDNDPAMAAHFAQQQKLGNLQQKVLLCGTLQLAQFRASECLRLGPAKLHLHEAALPDFDETVAFSRAAHDQGRVTATHCVTEVELVFALAALREAGAVAGDRIEHAGVAPEPLADEIAALGLAVVGNPHFIAERGDHYLREVEAEHRPHLYPLARFARRGVTLAAGSDAPHGALDPWAAMRAAIFRHTATGQVIAPDEVLSPENALALYLADPEDLAKERLIKPGAPADLCLLDRPWQEAQARLHAADVRMTMIRGSIVHNRVDQAPV